MSRFERAKNIVVFFFWEKKEKVIKPRIKWNTMQPLKVSSIIINNQSCGGGGGAFPVSGTTSGEFLRSSRCLEFSLANPKSFI